MPKPPIWFTRFCYYSDRYHRELHNTQPTSFTSSPIRVLVNNGPDDPVVPFLAHASVLCRFSCWFRTHFEAHQRQQREAKANGTDMGPGTWHECTIHIPDCDPEVFEMYLNWQYKGRFPIPITMSREDEDDYDHGYPYTYWYEHDYQEGDWEGDEEEEEKDYYGHALSFLTKAYVLGRRVHDGYFQNETVRILKKILTNIMYGDEGLESGTEAFEKAAKVVREHLRLLLAD